ncbi:MAG: hypothetical protein PWQ57_1555 [Desulfovibrionales bacterium]|nr:hypothetical protein [Desulfovibrionales bacterium]
MSRCLCIHGHFYQPPREDPWLDEILPEGSAAPFLHWNERIVRESYSPLSCARRMDGQGRITELVNCYEWMSFNVGPTLLGWLKRKVPETYERIRQADKASEERFGRGGAVAQIMHHVIMPLASLRDKRAETAWAVSDFQAHFGRDPEGMWLSEAAVDTETLEVLAEANIRFTILAPRQARAITDPGSEQYRDVAEHEVDIREPYQVDLPSGRSIAVFFYNGPVSQAVAFENLLADGGNFWRRIVDSSSEGLLSLATDGETYGHHFHFGDMALAYVLDQASRGADGIELTNFAAYLAKNPPRRKARLWEPSSWSCVHGVERWRSDCGCSTGGHPDWNQQWRAPLRKSLDILKAAVDRRFDEAGAAIFKDPDRAFIDFGQVVSGRVEEKAFATSHFRPKLSGESVGLGFTLLSMQKWALAMYASCAWFFDDLARIEPVNGLTYALRALDLLRKSGGQDVEEQMRRVLSEACSNDPAWGRGDEIWDKEVVPRRETSASLVGQAVIRLLLQDRLPEDGREAEARWSGVSVRVSLTEGSRSEGLAGDASIQWRHETMVESVHWSLEGFDPRNPLDCVVRVSQPGAAPEEFRPSSLPWKKQQALAVELAESVDEDAWSSGVRRNLGANALYLPFQEAQVEQTRSGSWRVLAPWMVWEWIERGDAGAPAAEELRSFLQTWVKEHEASSLGRRLGDRLAGMLSEASPDFGRIESMVRRAEELGLRLDMWPVQNAWGPWRNSGAEAVRLGRALGFAV